MAAEVSGHPHDYRERLGLAREAPERVRRLKYRILMWNSGNQEIRKPEPTERRA